MDGKKSTVKKRVVRKMTPTTVTQKSIDNPVDDPNPNPDFIDEYLDNSGVEETYPAAEEINLNDSGAEETYPADEEIDNGTCSVAAFSGNTPVLQENIEPKVKLKDGYYKDNLNKYHMM